MPFSNDGRMGRFKFSLLFISSLNRLKCDGQCSVYLIAILALRVKCHSLKERNVLGNVIIVDHHVKKIYS